LIPDLFYYLAGVPLLGFLAQWLAWRLRLPAILLLLAFGIILGNFFLPDAMLAELTGADESVKSLVESRLLFPLVSLSVAIILFEGGLTLELKELKTSGTVVARLVTVGALVSWALTALVARLVLGIDVRLAVLLGAILVVTGPTVVTPLLRHIRPARRIGSIAKWEGIVIDPIGALLAVLVFEEFMFSANDHTFWNAVLLLLKTAAIGGLLGGAAAWLLAQCLKRYWLPDFLHGVAFLTVALGAFAISN
jgi:NhaP-type Na+/H+ or K+/H+ antiporter